MSHFLNKQVTLTNAMQLRSFIRNEMREHDILTIINELKDTINALIVRMNNEKMHKHNSYDELTDIWVRLYDLGREF